MHVVTDLELIGNALKRVAYFEPNFDMDCPLYVEGPDGSFRELLGCSEETGQTITEPLRLRNLRGLLPKDPGNWDKVWNKFDAERNDRAD